MKVDPRRRNQDSDSEVDSRPDFGTHVAAFIFVGSIFALAAPTLFDYAFLSFFSYWMTSFALKILKDRNLNFFGSPVVNFTIIVAIAIAIGSFIDANRLPFILDNITRVGLSILEVGLFPLLVWWVFFSEKVEAK